MGTAQKSSPTFSFNMNGDDSNTPKTIIVIGVARGGTSMVAGVLRKFDIFMGDNLANNHEDPLFIAKPAVAMKQTIEKRNKNHDVWGWKNPNSANFIENLKNSIVNPYLVVVDRDIVATAKAHVRWHGRDPYFAFNDIMLLKQKNILLTMRWNVPTLMVSYEKSILNPNEFINEVATFIKKEVPSDQVTNELVKFMRPGKYKQI